jgi:hypothetical protein
MAEEYISSAFSEVCVSVCLFLSEFAAFVCFCLLLSAFVCFCLLLSASVCLFLSLSTSIRNVSLYPCAFALSKNGIFFSTFNAKGCDGIATKVSQEESIALPFPGLISIQGTLT